ncbi:MAG: hypothetical protein K5657_04230 [Desulfovibrio sp.]|nr:hypothetical protein [Desulfovibrio sp.]
MFKVFIQVLLILASCASNSFALSDNEYKKLMQTSEQYRKAETELKAAWGRAYKKVTRIEGMARRELLDSQRRWIDVERDKSARAYMQQGMSKAQAYAKVTLERATYLNSFGR